MADKKGKKNPKYIVLEHLATVLHHTPINGGESNYWLLGGLFGWWMPFWKHRCFLAGCMQPSW